MNDLNQALSHAKWLVHKPGDIYSMDGVRGWELWYYPIFECGKTKKQYDEPRALMGKKKIFGGGVEGIDFREVPLRFIEKLVSKQD